jgi:hypothetical protein
MLGFANSAQSPDLNKTADKSANMCKSLVFFLVAVLTLNPVFAQSQSNDKLVIPPHLNQQYPNAEFRIASMQDYEKLRHSNFPSDISKNSGSYLLIVQQDSTETQPSADEISTSPGNDKEPCEGDCDEEKTEHTVGEMAAGTAGNVLSGMAPTTPEGLVVVLVIVGMIMVAALVFYAGVYLYDLTTGKFELPSWWEIRANLDFVSGDKLNGTMSGVRFKTGLSDKKANLGLVIEGGYYDLDVENDGVMEERAGGYWLAGPSIELVSRDNPVSLGFEFLGGHSLHSKIGVMSTMKLAFNIKASESIVIGIHFGGLYTDLKNTSGLIDRLDEYSWSYGLDMGGRF